GRHRPAGRRAVRPRGAARGLWADRTPDHRDRPGPAPPGQALLYGGRIPPDPGDRGATARDPAAARVGRPVDAADGTADPARRPGPQIPLPAYRLHTRRR